jgi:hypothetical protein
MLRSAGFEVVAHPEEEVFLCRVKPDDAESDIARATQQARESVPT